MDLWINKNKLREFKENNCVINDQEKQKKRKWQNSRFAFNSARSFIEWANRKNTQKEMKHQTWMNKN